MKCNHCNSEWNTGAGISSSFSSCPFCGESLVEEKFENSKDALAAVMNRFGADVLLGEKLKTCFSDLAPAVPQNIKRLVYAVYENEAAQILKENLNAPQTGKESAVKSAIKNMTDAFIVPDKAESIIYEFIAALGWKIPVPVAKTVEPPEKPVQPEPKVEQAITPEKKDPKPVSPSRGNIEVNNIVNGGIVATQGDWVYYGPALSKMRTDMTEKQVLNDDACRYINVSGDWVYYTNAIDSRNLYRIRTDGTERKKLNDDSCRYINVVSNWVYYCNISDEHNLYRIRTDGTKRKRINDDSCNCINVTDDWVYFINGSTENLYRIRPDGTGRKKLNDDQCSFINVVDDWVYYCNVSDEHKLYRIRPDGTGRQKLNDDKYTQFNIVGEWVYYSNFNVKNKLYKIRMDGTERHKLDDGKCSDINVVGEWVYYYNDYHYYRIRTDGTDCQPV